MLFIQSLFSYLNSKNIMSKQDKINVFNNKSIITKYFKIKLYIIKQENKQKRNTTKWKEKSLKIPHQQIQNTSGNLSNSALSRGQIQ